MRNLILTFPNAAEIVLDRCIQRSSPTNSERLTTYDFRLLDPGPDGQIGPKGARFSGLATMVEGKQQTLLLHKLSRKLLNVKWMTYGWCVYWTNFIVYLIFIALLTVFLLTERNAVKPDDPGEREGNFTVDDSFHKGKTEFNTAVAYIVAVFALVQILKEIYQVMSQRLQYFTHPTNLLELALYVTAIVFVMPYINFIPATGLSSKPHIYWQIGTWCVFLSYVNLILFVQTVSYVGLYVTMFLEVSKTLLKASCLFIMFTLAFSVVFYILFKEQVS